MIQIDFWLKHKQPLTKPIPKVPAIYQIISPSGKIYFGQTKNLNRRFSDYYRLNCERQRRLYNSLKKYGIESHQIFYMQIPTQELYKYEECLIAYYKTLSRKCGLNLVGGGDNRRYIPKAVGKKISKTKKGITVPHKKEKRLSESHKKNIGFGVKTSLIYQFGIASRDVSGEKNSFYGKSHSEEFKRKLSAQRKGLYAYKDNPSAKPVLDKVTGEVFGCAKEVAELIGVKEGTFTSWLSGNRPNKSNFQYL